MISILCGLALAWGADEPSERPPEGPAGPDRSAPPEVGDSPLLSYAAPERHTIAPGVEAWYVQVPGVRKVAVHAVLGRGMVEWGKTPNFPNRALGALADVAAGDLSGAELSTARDINEIDLWSLLRLHDGEVSLLVPVESLAKGVELQRLVLAEPSFPKKDVKRWILDQQLFYTVEAPASQAQLAGSALAYAWFPADHPYGVRPDLSQLSSVKGKDLVKRWSDLMTNAPITVLVAGDLPWSAAEGHVKTLVQGLGKDLPKGEALPVTPPEGKRLVAVDMPGQPQAAIRVRIPAPTRDHADAPEMMAANFVLGGYFLSRLNRNLREEKGFTYGAGSSYSYTETYGFVTVSVDVKSENVAATIAEIEHELAGLYAPAPAPPPAPEPPPPPPPAPPEKGKGKGKAAPAPAPEPPPPPPPPPDPLAGELLAARRSFAAEWNRWFERADSAMSLYRSLLRQEQTIEAARQVISDVGAVAPDDVRRVASEWLSPDDARVWVIVGDRKAIEPELTKAGLTEANGFKVQWTNPNDAILGKF